MKISGGFLGAFLTGVLLWNGLGWAGPADEGVRSFAQGEALLAQADFSGAAEAFAVAAKADPNNAEYRASLSLLRRVMDLRERLGRESNQQKWESTAGGLRTYYYENKIYSEALALDRRFYEQLPSADSAARLAETQLVLGKNAEAAELLAGLDEPTASPRARLLLGIALARQGKAAEARRVGEAFKLPEDAGPGLFFEWARLRTLLGEPSEALALLTRCFERTPPSRLGGLKVHAQECPDLKPLQGKPEFSGVLETASKVPESKCSSGTSCAKCPSRSACVGEKR